MGQYDVNLSHIGRFYKGASTHLPVLIRVALHTKGPILELGAGLHSTPLLHWLCYETKRPLYTYEDNPEWFRLSRKWQNRYHRIRQTTDWKFDFKPRYFSMAFVDQGSKHRWHTARYLSDKADYVVLHDSEPQNEKHYRWSKVWPYYKYRWDYTLADPWTTVLSNFEDPSWLGDEIGKW